MKYIINNYILALILDVTFVNYIIIDRNNLLVNQAKPQKIIS